VARLTASIAKLFTPGVVTLSQRAKTALKTWELFEDVVADLEKKDLTHEQQLSSITAQQTKCDAFDDYFNLHWGAVCHVTGFYKHYMKSHLAKDRKYLYDRFKIEMWMLSTSISEHGNKMAKTSLRHIQGFNRGLKNKFWLYMRDCVLRLLKFPESFLKTKKNKEYTCSVCREKQLDPKGHTKRNAKCPFFSKVADMEVA
jgi:hypothetical protein